MFALRTFLALSAAAAAALPVLRVPAEVPPPAAPAGTQPNFLVVLIDDLGIEQLEGYKDVDWFAPGVDYPYADTPFLDEVARFGVRFEQARAYPTCSPTRFALHTGRYAFRTGVGTTVGPNTTSSTFEEAGTGVSPPITKPIATMLGDKNYATGMFGKLHLQLDPDDPGIGAGVATGAAYACSELGFQEFEGVRRNMDTKPFPNNGPTPGSFTFYESVTCATPDPTSTQSQYATDYQRDAVIDWIDNQTTAWFALWNTNDIHGPFDWPTDHGFGASPPDGGTSPIHFNTRLRAKLEHLDRQIEAVWDSMDQAVRDNTYLIILGDNGTSQHAFGGDPSVEYPVNHPDETATSPTTQVSFAPYSQTNVKGTIREGGIRVPLLLYGDIIGEQNLGKSHRALVDVVDLYETLNELSTTSGNYTREPDAMDSISFAPVLRGTATHLTHDRKFSHGAIFNPNGLGYPIGEAVRYDHYYLRQDGNQLWKLIIRRDGATFLPWEFYEVDDDPEEDDELLQGGTHPELQLTVAEWLALVSG